MGSPAELTLYYRPPPSPETGGNTGEEYIAGLVEERRKIQSFQRELPLCMHLINQAIEACQNSHSIPQIGSPEEELEEPQSYVIPEKTCILKEFIPIKRSTDQDFLITETQNSGKLVAAGNYFAVSKSENAHQNDHNHVAQTAVVIDQCPTELAFVDPAAPFFHKEGGAFSPFCKKLDETNNGTERSSCSQSQQRKRRRCWSPDLHRHFLNALQHLGGSQVATPKQIKELMSVDGLTNDEVKSHLQKYRLHLKKPRSHVLSQTQTESVCWDQSVLAPTTSAPILLSRVDLYQPPISSHSLPNPPFYRGGRRRSISSKNSQPASSFYKGQEYSSLQESRECPHPDSNPRPPTAHYVEEANSDVENNNSSSSQSTPKS